MAIWEVLQLGDPRLREVCASVIDPTSDEVTLALEDLQDTLRHWRETTTYGLVTHCQSIEVTSEELRQKAKLLNMVTEQDIETAPDGTVAIAHRVAEDRTLSTIDPKMRHGRKITRDKVDGYKSHITVQNVGPEQARLVTGVGVTPANTADGEVLDDLVQERIELTEQASKQVMDDTA